MKGLERLKKVSDSEERGSLVGGKGLEEWEKNDLWDFWERNERVTVFVRPERVCEPVWESEMSF